MKPFDPSNPKKIPWGTLTSEQKNIFQDAYSNDREHLQGFDPATLNWKSFNQYRKDTNMAGKLEIFRLAPKTIKLSTLMR